MYDEEGYEGVNFKRISETTTIKRSTIYNYYATKEEILIDILASEMNAWKDELLQKTLKPKVLSPGQFAMELTENLIDHTRLLKLYSILFTLLETNCRLEKLIEFKITAISTSEAFCRYVAACNPHMKEERVIIVANQIMCYVLGLYPMSNLTDIQQQALEEVGAAYQSPEFRSLCITGIEAFIKD